MRNKVAAFVACVMMVSAGLLWAEDAKKDETTLKGTRLCAKCNLKIADKCQDVLQVKEGDATVNYYMADMKDSKVVKSGHVCSGSKENVTVTGVVSEKDGKKWIEVSKVE